MISVSIFESFKYLNDQPNFCTSEAPRDFQGPWLRIAKVPTRPDDQPDNEDTFL